MEVKMRGNSKDPKRKPRFNNMSIVNYLLMIVISTILIMIGVSMYQYYKNGMLPLDTLIQTSFAVLGGELLAMAAISISKNVGKNTDNNEEEEY